MKGDVDYRLIGRLSVAYMMTVISGVLRTRPVDCLDLLLVSAVFHANGPENRGVSRTTISRRLNIPLETVRRRVMRLIEKRALVERKDGLIFAYDNDLGLGNYAALDALNLKQLRQLFGALKSHGIDLD